MSEQLKLGQIITEPQHRDAIHIAVAPVTAATRLVPGQQIGFAQGSDEKVEGYKQGLGVVDPFLRKPVEVGQRFWMYLNPGSITSLRHEWTHPAFAAVEAPAASSKSPSEVWLREFAEEVGVSYARLLDSARSWLSYGDYHTLNYDTPDIVYRNREAFWMHYAVVTGEQVPEDKREDTFFTCSC